MKRTENFVKAVFGGILALVGMVFMLTACEVGLGGAIDTSDPRAGVTTPTIDGVVGGSVIHIEGSCEDDTGVAEVRIVRLYEKDGLVDYNDLGNATLSADGRTWTLDMVQSATSKTLYTFNGQELYLPDGTYHINILPVDVGGRIPKNDAGRSFKIDNTPPIFLITSPSSKNIEDPSPYGKTIKVKGTIYDTSDGMSDITVSVYNTSGASLGIQKTTDMTTGLGGKDKEPFEVLVAKQNDSDALSSGNYDLLYPGGASGDKKYYMEIELEDKANSETDLPGNKASIVYFRAPLFEKLKRELGVSTISGSDLMRGYNGTHSTYSSEQCDKVRRILDGTYDDDTSYYAKVSDSNSTRLAFSVNPNNTPKYGFGGLAYEAGTNPTEWSGRGAAGGSISISVMAGSDEYLVEPSSLKVYLQALNASGGTVGSERQLVVKKDDGSELGTEGTESATYIVTLPDDLNDTYYRLRATGRGYTTDDQGNRSYIDMVAAKNPGGYGFVLYSNKIPVTITSEEDQSYVKKLDSNSYSFAIKISDPNSPTTIDKSTGKIKYQIQTSQGYKTKSDFTSTSWSGLTINTIDGTTLGSPVAGIFSKTISGLAFTVDSETVGTIALRIWGDNGVESDKNVYLLYVDNKKPTINVNNHSELSGSAVIKETSSNYIAADGEYRLSGTWRDEDGSGVKILKYSTDGNTWTDIGTEYTSRVTDVQSWSVQIPVEEGDGKKIYLKAIDLAGNEFEKTYENIKFDFSDPKFTTVPTITKDDYVTSGRTFTAVAIDSYGLETITAVAKRDGSTVNSGNAGYNFSVANTAGSDTSKTATIEMNPMENSGSDGVWEITLTAKDKNDRKAFATFGFTVDHTAPVVKAGSIKIQNAAYDAGKWQNTTTAKIEGKITEAISLDSVYYLVDKADAALTNPSDITTSGQSVSYTNKKGDVDFTISVDGLKDNAGHENVVYLQPVDKAGNKGQVYSYKINVDQVSPEIETLKYKIGTAEAADATGTVAVNTQTLTLYGTYSDSGSGVNALGFAIGSTTVVPNSLSYTTEDVSAANIATLADTAWKAYNAAEKNSIKGWKATFESNKFANGTLKISGSDVAGNTVTYSSITLRKDTVKPTVSNVSIEGAYKKTDTVYYVNNTNTQIAVKGVSADDYALKNTVITIPGLASSPIVLDGATWTTGNLDISGLTGSSVSITVVSHDGAENESVATNITLNFDTQAPSREQDISIPDWGTENNWKDTKFRVGSGAGGNYNAESYSGTTSLQIQGSFTESGSGIKAIYYELVHDAALTMTASNYQSFNSFSPESDGTSFKTTLTGLQEGENKLRLIAVDNVGNVSKITDAIDKYESDFVLGVDQTAPTFGTGFDLDGSEEYVNGKTNFTITGGSASDDKAGIDPGSVKFWFVDKNNSATRYEITRTDSTYGQVNYTANDASNLSASISITVKPGTWFTEANLGTSPILYGSLADYSSPANSSGTVTILTTIKLDQTLPEIAIDNNLNTALITDENDNGKIKKVGDNYFYELTGTWSDLNGSGTDKLFYSINNGTDWIDADTLATKNYAKSKAQSTWTLDIPVVEGSSYNFAVKAVDTAGNESEDKPNNNVTFDFTKPTISIDHASGIYGGSRPQVTVTANDHYQIKATDGITLVSATKNGGTATAGTDYTLSAIAGGGSPTATRVVTFSKDGVYEFTFKAVDVNNRESDTITRTWTIDTEAPEPKADNDSSYGLKINGEAAGTWYRDTNLRFDGYVTEAVSGFKTVYYIVDSNSTVSDDDVLAGTQWSYAGSNNTGTVQYSVTPTVGNGTSYVHMIFEDMAGNRSSVKTNTVMLDQEVPTISGKYYTYNNVTAEMPSSLFVNTGKSDTLILYGLVSETGSGIYTLSLTKEDAGFNPIIKYATGLSSTSSTDDFTGAAWTTTKTDATAWKAEISVYGLTTGAIQASVSDVAGNNSTVQLVSLASDSSAPSLTLTNSDLQEAPYGISEKSPYMTVNGDEHNYTFQGTWSDAGSGTYALYYSTTTDVFNASTWTQVPTSSAPQSTGTTNWTLTLDLAEGNSQRIAFCALDKVGNRSDVISKTGITVDYTDPTLTLTPETAQTYYPLETPASTAVWTINASDNLGTPNVTVVAKKDGNEVTSGTGGYTCNGSPKKITLANDSSANGTWNITVTATDGAGRKTVKTLNTIVDRSKPVINNSLEIHDGENIDEYDVNSWSQNGTLTIKGTINEAGSGVSIVYFMKGVADGVTNLKEIADENRKSVGVLGIGDAVEYELTVSDLTSGSTVVGIQVEDKAGNLSEIKRLTLNIDKTNPSFGNTNERYYSFESAANYKKIEGTVLSNGTKDLYIAGPYSDAGSGVDELAFEIAKESGNIPANCTVKYSTTPIATGGTNLGSISWQNYADIADKTSIKSYRAQISKDDFANGDGVVAKPKDRARNGSTQTIFTIAIDNVAPVIRLNTPKTKCVSPSDEEAVNTVNGTIKFEGTTDETSMDSLKLYWGTAQNACNTLVEGGEKTAAQSYNWSFNVPLSIVQSGTSVKFIDGTTYAGTAKTIYLKLVAEDKAGNSSEYVYQYNVDPDKDRPIITFPQLDLTGLTESAFAGLTTDRTLNGSVTDDDGVTKLEYKIGSGEWTELTVTNGNFSYAFTDETEYTIKFRVTDAAGTEFETKLSPTAQYLAPKFVDKNAVTSNYSVLNVLVDVTSPTVSGKFYNYNDVTDEMPGSLFVNTSENKTLTLYGLVSETGSGIDTLTLTKTGDTISPTIKYNSTLSESNTASDFTNATWGNTKTGATAWRATFSVSGLSNGAIQAAVSDVAGNTGSAQIVNLSADATVPTLTLSNTDLQGDAPYSISESSPYMTVDGAHHNYTFQGTWSDTGSGTYKLYYSTDSTAIGTGTWTAVDSSSAPQSTGTTNWTLTLDLPEGIGKQIAFYAEDKVGNQSSVISKTGITVDYSDPVLTVTPAAKSIYGKEETNTAEWTISATDTLTANPTVTVVAKKDETEVLSGNGGYTYNSSTKVITLANSSDADGTWNIVITATDGAGRSTSKTINTVIDRTMPVITDTLSIRDGEITKPYALDSWSRNGTLTLIGEIQESGSGLKALYYKKDIGEDATIVKGSQDDTVTLAGKGNAVDYEVTIAGFISGSTRVGLQTEDSAGNLSEIKIFTINVDKRAPTFQNHYYSYEAGANYSQIEGTVLSNGANDMYIAGSYSDSDSGIDELGFEIDEVAITGSDLEVEYSTDIISGGTNIGSMTWKAYSAITDKSTIKSYRAKISKNKFSSGGGVVDAMPKDRAGNGSTQTIFTISIDSTAPVLTLNTPKTQRLAPTADAEAVNTVNGTITFAGTTDETAMSHLDLYWGTAQNACNTLVTSKPAAQSYNWSFSVPLSTVQSGTTVKFIDGTTYAGSPKDIYLKLVAVDKAGNSVDCIYKYSVDPDKDRPIITFTQLDLTGLTENQGTSNVWLTGTKDMTGSVTDDDGISKLEYKLGDGNWTELTVINGNFSYTFAGESKYSMQFRVTDSAGTEFVTKTGGTQYLAPKFMDKNAYESNYSILNLAVDTKQPEISDVRYIANNGTDQAASTDFTQKRFGGDWKKFKIRFRASDDNGINNSSAKVVFNGNDYPASYAGGYYTTDYIIVKVDDDDKLRTGNYNATITVKDNAGFERNETVSFVVDNDAPTVKISQPSGLVSMAVQASGSLSEAYGLEHVYYMVTKHDVDPKTISATATNSQNGANRWKEYVLPDENASTFDIGFDNSSVDNHTELLKWYLVESPMGVEITTIDAINGTNGASRYTTLTTIDLHIKAVDAYGNIGYATKAITVDPQGDKPTVTITYPISGSTLGGSIPVMGTAIDNESADNVMIMIDMNNDGTWNRADIEALNTLAPSWLSWSKFDGSPAEWTDIDYNAIPTSVASASDWTKYGIRREVTNASWSLTLNQDSEFNPVSGTGTRDLAIWVYSTDEDGNTSQIDLSDHDKTPYVTFKIDKDTPQIANEYLVQYDNESHITAKYAYSKDMSITGEWYYEADIYDDSGIASVKRHIMVDGNPFGEALEMTSAGSYAGGDIVLTSKNTVTVGGVEYRNTVNEDAPVGFHIKMKVGSSAVNDVEYQDWKLTYMENKDSTPLSGEREVALNVDNKAPVTVKTGDYYNIRTTVNNENGFYTFGAQAKEDPSASGVSQTGVKRIAFYFTRDIDSASIHSLYDVMLANGAAGNAIDGYTSLTKENGLYWKSITGTASGKTFTLASVDKNVHTGGLVKINGVIYRIESVSGNTVSIEVNTTDTEPFSGVTSVKFAVANVVDNTTEENADESSEKVNGYYTNVNFDDGDHMVESLKKQSTTWTWEANINSKNLGDGSAVLHYVVFDAAGNFAEESVNVFVANNQPRIAGVSIGTDTNGNGEVDASEMISEGLSNIYDKGKQGNRIVTEAWFPSDKSSSILKILGKTRIKPEIVGGNGVLDYSYVVRASDDTTTLVTGNGTGIGTGNGESEAAQALTVDLTMAELLGMGNRTNNRFALTISDQTPGGALSATLNIIVDSLLEDENAPASRIIPFYWVNGTKNSLFMESKDYGHIELPSDLPSLFAADGTGVYDRDPKLSGIVKIEGIAHDDVLLKSLTVNVGGTNYVIGTYNGSWTYTNEWNGSAVPSTWSSKITNATYREAYDMGFISAEEFDALDDALEDSPIPYVTAKYGHIVHWTLYLNTASLGNGTDKVIKTSAQDRGKAASAGGGNVSYTPNSWTESATTPTSNVSDSGTPTGYQKVDVVPYISKVYTGLAKNKSNNWSVYNRTALGHYPVQSVVSNIVTTGNYKIDLKTTTSETVTLYGFNINDSSVRIQSGGNTFTGTGTGNLKIDYSVSGQLSFNVAKLASGPLDLTINGFAIMNNINNNDAKGTATNAGTAYSNWYNRQGNGDTNNILTDDIWFDVWEFNDRASTPINGLMTGINMEINQKTKMLNYSFANGGLFYSMGGNTNKSTAYSADNSYSSIYWAGDWDTFAGPSVGFHVDDLGWTYSLDSGGDTNSSGSVDKWAFYTSRWGKGTLDTGGTLGGGNSLRLEEIGLKTGGGTYDYSLMKYRFLSAEFASTVSGNNTNLYLVYYDALTNQIRFRAGTFSGTAKQSVGGFQDQYTGGASSYYNTNNCQVIANGEADPFPVSGGTTSVPLISGRGAGQYVDVAVVKDNSNNDVVCVVWFDQAENALKYSYITNPIDQWNNLKGDATAKSWSTPITLFEGGEYCHIVSDKNGHLHVAAYAGNGDVKYAYLDTYTAEDRSTCTVDSSGVVGEHLTLDVAVSSKGNSIPYIGYYTAALKMPKYAYLVESSNFVQAPDGVDENELFTGKWEVTVVPSPSRLTTNREDKVNVGVWKNAGVLIDSKVSGSVMNSSKYNKTSGYSSQNWSKTFGNGTSNGVLGYQISTSTGSCLETAQMR